MKIALISDIHGNEPALDAVLMDIERESVDSIICLGDIATLGPSPGEVIYKIKNLKCPCIVGNHEEALFDPEHAEHFGIKNNLDSTLFWCIDKIGEDGLSFLRKGLQDKIIDIGDGKKMYCYHGSPISSIQGIYPNTPDDVIFNLFNGVGADVKIVAGGHTHEQMLRQNNHVVIINPGSVGCAFKTALVPKKPPSYTPVAEYAIVNCAENGISVELKRINFDIQRFIELVINSTLPLKDWWINEFKTLGLRNHK